MSMLRDRVDPIHLAVCCDQDYVMPLAAMLASLVARADPRRPLIIHALGYGLSRITWNKLKSSLPDHRVQWDCIELDTSELLARGFHTRPFEHISPVTYARLLLPELLPGTLEKVLYLDCDLIVCDDIAALWDTDIDTVDFAAAPERNLGADRAAAGEGIRFYRDLGMHPDQILCNVGVLLINLRRWRQARVACRAFAYLRCLGHELRWYEQDALNVVANGRYGVLESRWNVPPWAGQPESSSTSIVHYVTAHKPWHWHYAQPQRELFFAALDQTAWTGWRPERPRFGLAHRVLARATKAMRKRRHALVSAWRSLHRDATYRLLVPPLLGGSHAVPSIRSTGSEIRLFLSVPRVDGSLVRVLEAYGRAGVDRAVVLALSGLGNAGQLPAGDSMPLHLFGCGAGSGELALRRLLDRYGEGHWCVLGNASGHLVDDADSPVALREYCTRLEREGVDVAEGILGTGEQIELIARDVRSGRVFRSTALAAWSPHAYDPPVFGSRAVLLKYRKNMLLDAEAALTSNVRKSAELLRFSPQDA
jgi:lipopolysaccharide biosynthesis glycosyltransferase